jgi:inorganic pyrophosphatase
MKRLDQLPLHDDEGRLQAVLETPQGSRHKLKYEPSTGSFAISSTLPAGMSMPFDFGFFPGTKAQDGDPLDVLVLLDAPAYPGVTAAVRLLGVIEAEQSEDGGKPYRNDRLIAVAEGSSERGDLHRLSDLDDSLLTQIESFFETYDRFTGKTFKALGRRGERVAARYLEEARRPSNGS